MSGTNKLDTTASIIVANVDKYQTLPVRHQRDGVSSHMKRKEYPTCTVRACGVGGGGTVGGSHHYGHHHHHHYHQQTLPYSVTQQQQQQLHQCNSSLASPKHTELNSNTVVDGGYNYQCSNDTTKEAAVMWCSTGGGGADGGPEGVLGGVASASEDRNGISLQSTYLLCHNDGAVNNSYQTGVTSGVKLQESSLESNNYQQKTHHHSQYQHPHQHHQPHQQQQQYQHRYQHNRLDSSEQSTPLKSILKNEKNKPVNSSGPETVKFDKTCQQYRLIDTDHAVGYSYDFATITSGDVGGSNATPHTTTDTTVVAGVGEHLPALIYSSTGSVGTPVQFICPASSHQLDATNSTAYIDSGNFVSFIPPEGVTITEQQLIGAGQTVDLSQLSYITLTEMYQHQPNDHYPFEQTIGQQTSESLNIPSSTAATGTTKDENITTPEPK